MPTVSSDDASIRTAGLISGAAAYFMWGVLPVYWKSLLAVPPLELICHRVVWCMVFLAIGLTLQRHWRLVLNLWGQWRTLGLLVCSASLVAVNWFVYVWAVNNGHVVEGSLGYYINPLVNVLLGFLFFRDKLNRLQNLAIFLAAVGVAISVASYGAPPWIALTLAFSFGFYGLVRKVARVAPIPGLFVETFLLSFLAGAYIIMQEAAGSGAFHILSGWKIPLLMCSGAVTALPLLCFAYAVRRLRLATMGILQYLAPTLMLLLGTIVYGEPFGTTRIITFFFIWCAVALYVADGLILYRNEHRLLARARKQ